MKSTILIALCLIFYCVSLNGQVIQWANLIEGEGEAVYSFQNSTDSFGNIYVAGITNQIFELYFDSKNKISTSRYGGFIVKYDSEGNFVWGESIKTTSGTVRVHHIQVGQDNNIYILGYYQTDAIFNNNITLPEDDIFKVFIAKYSFDGICQWAIPISNVIPGQFEIDTDGHFYITGTGQGIIRLNNSIVIDSDLRKTYIAKLDNNGYCEWASHFEVASDDYYSFIKPDNHGNIYIAGDFSKSEIHFNDNIVVKNNGERDIYFAKVDNNGNFLWAKSITGLKEDGVTCIDISKNGNIYITGSFTSDKIFFSDDIFLEYEFQSAGFLSKFSSDGECEWAASILPEYGGNLLIRDVMVNELENIYITGHFYRTTITFDSEIKLPKASSHHSFFAKYDISGKCLWAKDFYGENEVMAYSINVDKSANIMISGNFSRNQVFFSDEVVIRKKLEHHNSKFSVFVAKYQENIPILIYPLNESKNISLNATFTWHPIPQATKYRFQLSKHSNFEELIIDEEVSDTSFVVNDLDFNNEYYWRVSSYQNTNISQWSEIWSFTTVFPSIPSTPILVSPENLSINQLLTLTLRWNAVEYAEYYDIQLSLHNDFGFTKDYNMQNKNSLALNDLKYSTEYFWRVRAVNQSGESQWSDSWSFITVPPKPNKPNLIAPIHGAEEQSLNLTLHWSNSDFAEKYELQIATNEKFEGNIITTIENVTEKGIGEFSLNFLTEYFWRVRAINITGKSDWSDIWRFKTQHKTSVSDIDLLSNSFNVSPNPFSNDIAISLALDKSDIVTIELYDITGNFIEKIFEGIAPIGKSQLTVNNLDIARGFYILTLKFSDGKIIARKVLKRN